MHRHGTTYIVQEIHIMCVEKDGNGTNKKVTKETKKVTLPTNNQQGVSADVMTKFSTSLPLQTGQDSKVALT
jgi:hypothetical protein